MRRGGGARAGLAMPTLDNARAGPPLHARPVLKCNKTRRNRQVKARHDSCGKCNRHKAFFDIVGLALKIQKKRVKIITNDNFVVSLHCNT